MPYTNSTAIQYLIAQTLTTGTNDTPVGGQPGLLIQIGNQFKKNLITDDIINQWITWADNQIDSILGSMYSVPFCPIADFETFLYSDISEYNPYVIINPSCTPFNVADNIVIIENGTEEQYTIQTIIGNGVYETSTPLVYMYSTNARVVRVKFPDPINLISTRLAAANLYEKYFAAMTNPQNSDYGTTQKKMAKIDLNNILTGRIRLRGAHMTGDIFKNPAIRSRYNIPGGENIDNNSTIEDIG